MTTETTARPDEQPAATKPTTARQPAAKKPSRVAGATGAEAEQADAAAPSPKTVEQLRDEQLKAGQTTGEVKKAAEAFKDATPAEHRAGRIGAKPLDGRVDNMTRRSDADVLDGHFCRIDYGKLSKAERASVESIVGEGNTGVGRADYGIYLNPGQLAEDGYPLTAVVLLRDEHSAQIVVPYDALVPAQAGGR